MKHTKKPLGVRLMGLLLALSLLPGMVLVGSAKQGDYAQWKEECETTGEDPYEQYYEPWDIPSVEEVYQQYGEAVADYYVENFVWSLQSISWDPDDAKRCMQTVAADLEKDKDTINAAASAQPTESQAPVSSETPNDQDTQQNTQYFADVPADAWYAEAVNAMAQTNLIGGRPDGLFHPEDTITLGEWATIVWRIVGGYVDPDGYLNPKWTPGSVGESKYPHWASKALYWTGSDLNTGLFYVNGTCSEDGSTEETPCSRYQAVLSIVQMVDGERSVYEFYHHHWPDRDDGVPDALEARQKQNNARVWTITEIPDYETIPEKTGESLDYTGREAVVRAYNLGIINGMDETGTFNPEGTLTRAQACQMLYNAMLTRSRPVEGNPKGGTY